MIEKSKVKSPVRVEARQRRQKSKVGMGFTLIELLLVVVFISIITSLGVASYVSYANSQVVQQAANDVTSLLTLAKSRSLYQVKPDDVNFCRLNDPLGLSLEGYRFAMCKLSPAPNPACSQPSFDYEVDALCGGNIVFVQGKNLPPNVSFNIVDPDKTAPSSYFFPVITGGINNSGFITLAGYNLKKKIQVDFTGNIKIMN